MAWYEYDISKETAIEFFNEAHEFSKEYVINNMSELSNFWPPTNKLPSVNFDYDPKGVVVHSSHSPSIWNTLKLQCQHIYGSHIIIFSGRRVPADHYPLLNALKANVLAPYQYTDVIPHSGYLSTHTWGVELRNVGYLRPIDAHMQAFPLTPTEENEHNFFAEKSPNELDYYWRKSGWTEKFEGQAFAVEGYHFERVSEAQARTLLTVLKCMKAIAEDDFDTSLVIPSNCVTGDRPILPSIPWQTLREVLNGERQLEGSQNHIANWINEMFTRSACTYEGNEIDDQDETFLREQIDASRWRGERDDGLYGFLSVDKEFDNANANKTILDQFGYDISKGNINKSLRMYSIAKGLQSAYESDIYTAMSNDAANYHLRK